MASGQVIGGGFFCQRAISTPSMASTNQHPPSMGNHQSTLHHARHRCGRNGPKLPKTDVATKSILYKCHVPTVPGLPRRLLLPSYLPHTARSSLVVYPSISFLVGATQAPIRRVNINSVHCTACLCCHQPINRQGGDAGEGPGRVRRLLVVRRERSHGGHQRGAGQQDAGVAVRAGVHRLLRAVYGNFDIILDHLSGTSGLFTTPHTPCAVLYVVTMRIGC